jgi:hypothetical protein
MSYLCDFVFTEEKNLKVRMDDLFMLRYLRSNNFDPKKSFDKVNKLNLPLILLMPYI